jgi:hypothetical protein
MNLGQREAPLVGKEHGDRYGFWLENPYNTPPLYSRTHTKNAVRVAMAALDERVKILRREG